MSPSASPPPLASPWPGEGALDRAPESVPPPSLPPSLPLALHAQPAVSAELRADLRRIQRLQGPQERRALLLALLQAPGSTRERQAWDEETARLPGAAQVHALVTALPDNARLPVLEQALQGRATAPLAERTELLKAARRVMCADGKVGPLDRLRWLLMRHLLARPAGTATRRATNTTLRTPTPAQPAADPLRNEQLLADLPTAEREAMACFSAYLARLVPLQDDLAKVGAAGVAWYRGALDSVWLDAAPACRVPDTDALVQALGTLQSLSWMQRPVLARTWVHAALKVHQRLMRGEPLPLAAAEALRIATRLLDSPLHPVLTAHFLEDTAGADGADRTDAPRH